MKEAQTEEWLEHWKVRTKKGDVVRFLGEGGLEFQLERALRVLKPEEQYTVAGLYADSWGVSYYLEGIPNRTFPEDMFERI